MKTGKVKFFNKAKGFGFIKDDDSGKDIFVHVSGTREEIQDGDEVEFNIEAGKKGDVAVKVARIK